MTSLLVRARARGGFLLLETMIGVAVFALAMLALGRGVERCVDAQKARLSDEAARGVLANRMAEIEAGAVSMQGKKEELGGQFKGITLKQTREPLRLKDERGKNLDGLAQIQLEASWQSGGTRQIKSVVFYVFEKR